MNANDLKKLVTRVRRTDTVLRQLARQLDLNVQDRGALFHAADLLTSNAKQVARKAKEAKTEEQVRAMALATAVEEARRLGKVWSVETTLDKVALCLGNLMESNLRQDLESQPRDPLKSLDYWVELAMSELPSSVAWKAIQTKQPVATVMEQANVRLQQIRFQPKTIELARLWDMAASHNSGLQADI
jgi:hypothetical protein